MDEKTCRHCRHFDDDPASFESEIPNLTILGSAFASVRGEAGLCARLGRFHDPMQARDCAFFEPRPGSGPKSCAAPGAAHA